MSAIPRRAAWVVRGGPLEWVAILAGTAAIVRAAAIYIRAGEDTDEGALVGSRADERQQLLRTRSRAMAGNAVTAAAFIGLVITIATRSPAWWPFTIILLVAIFGYLFGLSTYGTFDDDPAEDETAADPARSPVG